MILITNNNEQRTNIYNDIYRLKQMTQNDCFDLDTVQILEELLLTFISIATVSD